MSSQALKAGKERKSVLISFLKPCERFWQSTPMLLGVILLIGLFQTFLSREMISSVFTGAMFRDSLIGTLLGSISAGNALNSYIIGGELLDHGVSLFAVTAFIVAWVTVGIIQYPAEAAILGRKFAFARNVLSFILAILVSIAIVMTYRILP